MSTRSAIGIRYGTIIKAVYCHWDGYVEHNGAILQEHYNSVKANKLLSLGDVSSLRPEIGEAHPFSRSECNLNTEEWEEMYGNMCTFYGRDRGESNTEFTTHNSIEEFREEYRSRVCEYFYLLEGDRWTYSHYSSDEIKDLASVVANINVEETV
jgi:hypothetical protein